MRKLLVLFWLTFAISLYGQKNISGQDCSVNLKVNESFCPTCGGSNDVFTPVVTDLKYDSLNLTIYNRWGQKLFAQTSAQPFWDGKSNDDPMPQGVYFWTIKIYAVNTRLLTCSGSVSLIR